MLHVFFVGSGVMLTFDVTFAFNFVSTLQSEIEKKCSIPVDNQVLLVSGGSTIGPTNTINEFEGAGSDTNPVFLFAKSSNEVEYTQPFYYNESESELDLKERVEACENMAADYQTLTVRSQLARDFADLANQESRICSELVYTQHLQQQGWAAVIANLEDTTTAFKRHVDLLMKEAQQYFQSRPLYLELLQKFPDAVALLAKVPVLRSLMSGEMGDEGAEHDQTLLTRYCTEPRDALEKMADQCNKWIYQFDVGTLNALNSELSDVLRKAEDPSMKEVKGIGERLFMLDKMKSTAEKYARDQCQHAESLSIHHTRVCSSNEMSVLNDLCRMHQMLLHDMCKKHLSIRDLRERCSKGKYELCENLRTRIKWVSYVQNEIFNLNNKVAIYRENLRRLVDHLDVIQQIHLAPTIYVKTLAEIHRRKDFSDKFLKWAKHLSEQALELYTEETNARKAFNAKRTENFVNNLFPGMDDLPPPFATQCPKPFDQLLPDITQEDLEKIKNELPELASMMHIPPPQQMPHMSQKSMVSDSAISSEVPSSQAAAPSSASMQGGQLFRTETLSSLGAGECIGPASPTSSPFEEPFLPATDMENATKHGKPPAGKKQEDGGTECKRLHLTDAAAEKEMFSPIVEEQNNVESDGDEFERVEDDPKLYDAFVACSEGSGDAKHSTVNKASEPVSVPTGDTQLQVSTGSKSQGLVPTPVDERLRSPDSMVTSHDFQSADYFIDDSMPSSYTESTGTSALGRGHHMVKSHHVIVAELQHQLDEKQSALVGTQGSRKMSRSNILLHRKICALQRYVQDIQDRMKSDLQHLKDHVIEQRSTVTEEISDIMKNVNSAITDIHQVQLEKENAVCEAMRQKIEEFEQVQKQNEQKLEVEAQKLLDAHAEIELYREQIMRNTILLDDLKQEYESKIKQMESTFKTEKADILKGLVLEHELELECLRQEVKHSLQKEENEIAKLNEVLVEKQTHIEMLSIEKETIEAQIKEKLLKDQQTWLETTEASFKAKYEAADAALKAKYETAVSTREEHQSAEKDEIKMLKSRMLTHERELSELFHKDLAMKLEERETELREQFEEEKLRLLEDQKNRILKQKDIEIPHLIEKASIECISAVESMHSRFKLTSSTTSVERMSLESSLESSQVEEETKLENTYEKEFSNFRKKLSEVIDTVTQKLGEAMEAEKERVSSEFSEKAEDLQNQHNVKVEKLKAQHRAEQQVSFNEVIDKVTHEKDKIIEDLRNRILYLEQKIGAAGSVVKTHFEGEASAMEHSSAEMQLSGVKSKTHKFQDATRILLQVQDLLNVPLMVSIDATFQEDRVQELERELKLEKIKLQTTKTMLDQVQNKGRADKISILTCDVGDLVLFFFDEKLNNYIAFYFGPVPHFLHPDSHEALNIMTFPPESKASWSLTVVIEKEYCMAKKATNRYKVPSGSRFYRVKVKPWDQEEARQRMLYPPPIEALSWVRSASVSVCTPTAFASGGEKSDSSHMSSSAI